MRAVLCFGDFRIWNFELEPGREFRPIYIIHPPEQLSMTTAQLEAGDIPKLSVKKMEFEYVKRLDAELLEYRFARET